MKRAHARVPVPRRGRRLLFAAAVAASVSSLAVAAAPQSAPGKPATPPPQEQPKAQAGQQGTQEQRPTFRAEANYVRVDVYPTAGGRPVMDLAQGDFQVLEDNVPQQIASFEHVVVQAAGAQEGRIEPNTVRESREMSRDPRARLFVLFLDTYHVSGPAGHHVRGALVRLLERTIGQDDLVAVMTPEMAASDVTFARKTQTIEEILGRYWDYGKRDRTTGYDPEENAYISCYPSEGAGLLSGIAREMIERRREKMTLDALGDLVIHLEGLREERKAIFAVSEGWALYRPDSNLARPTGPSNNPRVPGPPPVGVGTDGRLRAGDLGRDAVGTDLSRCDQDRIRLAQEDHELDFRRLLDMANRANASFYPIDPRGLPVFDSPIGPEPPPSPVADQGMLGRRIDALQTLAGATDGLAIVNSNDIDRGLKRVVDDLTSYYLIGYYSSNSRMDGRFRSIKVRVTRPGVDVRARRGYLAPTREEVEARRAAEAGPVPDPSGGAALLSSLARIRSDAFVQAAVGYDWRAAPDGAPRPVLWAHVELDPAAGSRDEQWKAGGEVTFSVTGPDKAPVDEVRQLLTREARLARVALGGDRALAPGDYLVRVSSKPAGTTLGRSEILRVTVPDAGSAGAIVTGQPALWRRGPFSGAGWQPAGDVRFRRQERVRVEVPILGTLTASSARLLDRNGNALPVPVIAARRVEDGRTIATGDLTLAPLAAGDYLLETTLERDGATKVVLAVFQIINS